MFVALIIFILVSVALASDPFGAEKLMAAWEIIVIGAYLAWNGGPRGKPILPKRNPDST